MRSADDAWSVICEGEMRIRGAISQQIYLSAITLLLCSCGSDIKDTSTTTDPAEAAEVIVPPCPTPDQPYLNLDYIDCQDLVGLPDEIVATTTTISIDGEIDKQSTGFKPYLLPANVLQNVQTTKSFDFIEWRLALTSVATNVQTPSLGDYICQNNGGTLNCATHHESYFVGPTSGSLCTDEACQRAFRTVYSTVGFHPECQPDYCHHYLVGASSSGTFTIHSTVGLFSIFDKIDTIDKTAIYLFSLGYEWPTLFRPTSTGFELVALQLASSCPKHFHKVLLEVTTAGKVVEKIRERDPTTKAC